jgi:hypothetical protein
MATSVADELSAYVNDLESLLPRFKDSSSLGLFLASEDEARFLQLITELKDIFDESFGKGNDYTANLIHRVNAGSGGYLGGPSYLCVQEVIALVKASIKKVERVKSAAYEQIAASQTDIEKTLHILRRFHQFAKQLRIRHGQRPQYLIQDEYDVQDLLRAILFLHFDDVRDEEHTPSYAGGASRVDFLLKASGIVIEVKKTREGLSDKEIGSQLIIDIARYAAHPDIKFLVCFIYDPEERIRNSSGLIGDLEELSKENLPVFVIISPS